MTAMWKYAMAVGPFSVDGGQVFTIPVGAEFRACGAQGATIALWFEVDTTRLAETEERWFRFFGTGFALQGEGLTYLGTVLFDGGSFVLHVYEAQR